jgi:peptidoglycan hydrolase CwlO-like protein
VYDRNYWRSCDTSRLIEDARHSGHELSIVLGERLEDMDVEAQRDLAEAKAQLDDLTIECNQLDDKVYELRAEIEKLELMIADRDRIIDELNRSK